jgi:hypothetical protein
MQQTDENKSEKRMTQQLLLDDPELIVFVLKKPNSSPTLYIFHLN